MKKKTNAYVIPLLLVLFCSVLCPTPASASQITLNFTSLPSAQGWLFENGGSGVSEEGTFSVDGNSLALSTLGTGPNGQGYYQMAGVIDPTLPFSIEVTAEVLSAELGPVGALSFGATGLGLDCNVLLGPGAIQIEGNGNVTTLGFDTALSFNTYLLQVTPSSGEWTFSINGAGISSGQIRNFDLPNQLLFGDFSTGVNGAATVRSFVFTQAAPVPTPEPSSLLMVGTGLLFCLAVARSRSSRA